jgi:Undecaprenyl-phosphate glucose phosphotransferase
VLQRQHRFFLTVLAAADLLIVVLAVVLAYQARFHLLAIRWPPTDDMQGFSTHSIPVLVAVPIMLLTMAMVGLYAPRRDQRFHREAADVLKAVVFGVALTVAAVTLLSKALFEGRDFSRLQYVTYAVLLATFLISWRYSFRVALRWFRKRGWNLRHVAIIGTGRLGQVVHHTLHRNSWTGITPSLFISHHPITTRETCLGTPVHGGLNDLEQVLSSSTPSGVIIAMPGRMSADLPELMDRLERFPVDVRVVPDMNPRYMPINMAVSELDGMPILSVRESPLSGWGRVTKRTLDMCGAIAGITVFAVPMILIGLLVATSGAGPIIFRQRRMSLNGHAFRIFKFRTMSHVDAECQAVRDTGCGTDAWTQSGDARVTRIGRFLRRTSLDELPQLFNVLLGEMSLVGPRPERPELMDRFKEDWRGYMLRQNVKAGITGWAQVNGLRGNTSLRKRLQYDLFYIRNWSIMFDIRILWMTIFRGFAHPNAQ